MTHRELVEHLAAQHRLTGAKVRRLLVDITAVAARETWSTGRFELLGLVTFRVSGHAARRVRHPVTGALMQLPAQRVVRARVSELWRSQAVQPRHEVGSTNAAEQ